MEIVKGPKMHYVYSVNFQYKSSKNHLRLIRGSTILDHTGTRFLGGRLIRGSDLYASIYGIIAAATTTTTTTTTSTKTISKLILCLTGLLFLR